MTGLRGEGVALARIAVVDPDGERVLARTGDDGGFVLHGVPLAAPADMTRPL